MIRPTLHAGVAFLLAAAWSTFAMAQESSEPDITASIVSVTGEPNAAQKEEIDAYAMYWVESLTSDDPSAVIRGRQRLQEKMRSRTPAPSAQFKIAYSAYVGRALMEAMNAESPLVRINAMIVAAELQNSVVLNMVKNSLGDANPAVRFLAAKAVERISQWPVVPPEADMRGLLFDMHEAYKDEQDSHVKSQIIAGLPHIHLDDAEVVAMQIFSERVDELIGNPNLDLSADRDALLAIYTKWVRDVAASPPKESLNRLAVAAFNYLYLSANLNAQGRVPASRRPQFVKMAELAEDVLVWAAKSRNYSSYPASFKKQIVPPINNWLDALLKAEDWRTLLIDTTKFGIAPAQLRQ